MTGVTRNINAGYNRVQMRQFDVIIERDEEGLSLGPFHRFLAATLKVGHWINSCYECVRPWNFGLKPKASRLSHWSSSAFSGSRSLHEQGAPPSRP